MKRNNRTIIDYNTWERRDNFEFFKEFVNPCYSVTCDIECTSAFENSKREKSSFFLKYLYSILRAVNEIPELRYRIENQECIENEGTKQCKEEIIVLYEKVSAITPIAVGPNGKFHSVNIPYIESFEEFSQKAEEIIGSIPKETNPYAAEKSAKDGVSNYMDMVLIAANPGLAFTSMTCTQSSKYGNRKPLINVGKATKREGKYYIPIFISVHHGLCDGYHLTRFYNLIEKYLGEL